jgi:hypothetical protein
MDGEGVVTLGIAHQLDGDRTAEPGVDSPVDLPHPTAADHLF